MCTRAHSADADANQNLNQNLIKFNHFNNNLGGQLRYFLNVAGSCTIICNLAVKNVDLIDLKIGKIYK